MLIFASRKCGVKYPKCWAQLRGGEWRQY